MILGWPKSLFRFFQWEKPNKYFGLLNNWLMCNLLEDPLLAQNVKKKKMSTMQETRVQSLCQEDPLEKEMATHSNILA